MEGGESLDGDALLVLRSTIFRSRVPLAAFVPRSLVAKGGLSVMALVAPSFKWCAQKFAEEN